MGGTMSEITKQAAGKPDWLSLLAHCQNALHAMVEVRMFGIAKYSKIAADAGVPFDPEGWKTNPPDAYIQSALRHMMAIARGERVNHEDGGVSHMAQAMVDLAFAYEIEHARSPPASNPCIDSQPEALPTLDDFDANAARAYLWADDGGRLPLLIKSVDDLPPFGHLVRVMARKKRWDDQCASAISVAHHSVMVEAIARKLGAEHPRRSRSCLMHDCAEVLCGDIPTPRKRLERAMLPPGVPHPNDVLTAAFNKALSERYDLELADPLIKEADSIAGCIEARARGIPDAALAAWYNPGVIQAAAEMETQFHLQNKGEDYDIERWVDRWAHVVPALDKKLSMFPVWLESLPDMTFDMPVMSSDKGWRGW